MSDYTPAAERQIAAILAMVEEQTGALVERIEIVDVDVTQVQHGRQQWLRHVRIGLKPVPGTRWAK